MHPKSCSSLCDPMDCNPPGSSVHGILQAGESGLPCPPPGGLPHPGVELASLVSCIGRETTNTTWETEQHYFSYPSSNVSSGHCKVTLAFSYLKYNIRNQRSQFHIQFIWIPDGHILKGYICVCVCMCVYIYKYIYIIKNSS